MTPLQQRELSKYEGKIKELHVIIEEEARKFDQTRIKREENEHAIKQAMAELEKIQSTIKLKNSFLSDLIKNAEKREQEEKEEIKRSDDRKKEIKKQEDVLKYDIKKKIKELEGMMEKSKRLRPLEKKYDSLENELKSINKKIEKGEEKLKSIEEKAEKILKNAQDKKEKADMLMKEMEERHRSLQKFETEMLFYYERMRKWYEDKGLKLPEKLKYKK